jgi:hypothetical protein
MGYAPVPPQRPTDDQLAVPVKPTPLPPSRPAEFQGYAARDVPTPPTRPLEFGNAPLPPQRPAEFGFAQQTVPLPPKRPTEFQGYAPATQSNPQNQSMPWMAAMNFVNPSDSRMINEYMKPENTAQNSPVAQPSSDTGAGSGFSSFVGGLFGNQ